MSDKQGLFWSSRRLLSDLLEIGLTRLALLSNEAQEGRLRLVVVLGASFLALFSLATGVVLLVFFMVLAFWESRLLVVGAASLFFLIVAAIFARKSRAELQRGPLLFSASLRELKRDIVSLRADARERDDFPAA
jgi:uncharacterized membrane protein YqjE